MSNYGVLASSQSSVTKWTKSNAIKKCPSSSSLWVPSSKRCERLDLTYLHGGIEMAFRSSDDGDEDGGGRKERPPRTPMGWIISCDTTVFLLMLSFPHTTHALGLLPLPLLWHGLTTPVTAFPQVWGLCWPLLLLTFCGKAPSVLTASQHPSEPRVLRQREAE